MRRVLVVRHGLSTVDDYNNNMPAFGYPDAGLMDPGKNEAYAAGNRLRKTYAVEPAATDVAVSELHRTYESALYMGFDPAHIGRYALLNEITPGIQARRVKEMIDKKIVPEVATFNAQRILEKPPVEPVWITSKFVIAALTKELGLQNDYKFFMPEFGEIRDFEIE